MRVAKSEVTEYLIDLTHDLTSTDIKYNVVYFRNVRQVDSLSFSLLLIAKLRLV